MNILLIVDDDDAPRDVLTHSEQERADGGTLRILQHDHRLRFRW